MDFCFYTRFADGIFGGSVQSFCVLYSLIQSIKFDETVTVISEKTILLTGISLRDNPSTTRWVKQIRAGQFPARYVGDGQRQGIISAAGAALSDDETDANADKNAA